MIGYGFNPVFVPEVDVASLGGFSRACRIPSDGLNKIFIVIIKASGIGYEFDMTFEERHGIKHLHFFALLPFDVLFGVGKPTSNGSRCGNGETNTCFEVAPITSTGAIEGVVGHSNGSVVDGDLWVFVVGSGLFTQFKLGFAGVKNGTT